MATKEVLIVEDEDSTREMIAFHLKRAGFAVREASDVLAARTHLVERHPDIILIDWNLPCISGLELTRSLKADRLTRKLPVILLTARAVEEDKITGLDGGADDYVTKPFSPRELVARIHALSRQSTLDAGEAPLQVIGLTMDRVSHRVYLGEHPLHLGPIEYRLLELFMMSPGRTYTRNRVIESVWGANVYIEERTIDVHIRRLRRVLETVGYGHAIETVRGFGYRFCTSLVERRQPTANER